MKTRPWPLVVLAFLYLLAPVANISLSALILQVSPLSYFWQVLRNDTALGLITFFALPPLAGLAIWAMKNWSYPLFLTSTVVMAYTNFESWQSRPDLMSWPVLVGTYAVNVGLVGYFLLPAVRAVYTDKRLRWWEAKPRFDMKVPALLKGEFGGRKCTLMDFSEGGAFVRSSLKLPAQGPVHLSFTFVGKEYAFEARIVHHRTRGVRGYGLQFMHGEESLHEARALASALGTLDRESPGRKPGPEAQFVSWLVKLLKTGKGLVPELPVQNEAHAKSARRKLAKVISLKDRVRSKGRAGTRKAA